MADKKVHKALNKKRKRLKSTPHVKKIKLKSLQNIYSMSEDYSNEDILENENEERQENSLYQLTKKVLEYIKNKNKPNININELVKDLGVKKRRIYDITNVLQGIGYIEKKGKNELIWIKSKIFNRKEIKPKNNMIQLYKQINEYDKILNKEKEELVSISNNNEFEKYGFIKFMDLKNLSKKENLDLIIIKANKGANVEIIDRKNSRKTCEEILKLFQEGKIELRQKNYKKINLIKNENHIFINSKESKIRIYRINGGEFNEIRKDENKGIYYYINKDLDIINNDNTDNNEFGSYSKLSNFTENQKNIEIKNITQKINEDLMKNSTSLIENKEKKLDDLEKQKNELNNKKFSIYDFLKWNENNIYEKNYNNIKKKYCGISSLFKLEP